MSLLWSLHRIFALWNNIWLCFVFHFHVVQSICTYWLHSLQLYQPSFTLFSRPSQKPHSSTSPVSSLSGNRAQNPLRLYIRNWLGTRFYGVLHWVIVAYLSGHNAHSQTSLDINLPCASEASEKRNIPNIRYRVRETRKFRHNEHEQEDDIYGVYGAGVSECGHNLFLTLWDCFVSIFRCVGVKGT